MISRGASSTHICWRCRLRHSKSLQNNSAPFPRPPLLKGARLQTNDAWLENGGSSSKFAQNPGSSRDDHGEDTPGTAVTLEQHVENSGQNPSQTVTVTEYPLGRLHGFRGQKQREKRARLNVDSLGRPTEVIVLRDAGFGSAPLPEMEEVKAGEKLDILKQLAAERGSISQAEVEKNIEEFRPAKETIPWTKLQQIQRQLVSGFTTSQLLKYFNAPQHWRKEEKDKSVLSIREGSTGVMKRTQWMPQISETGGGFVESSLRGYDSEAFTSKQRLALMILRQCWQVEAKELVESIGEVELEIPSRDLELLIEGRPPPLKLISNEFIVSQEETIEAFRSRGVVRITTTKDKSEAIVQAIFAMLQGIRSLTIDLNPLISGLKLSKAGAKINGEEFPSESSINELAQVTETHIRRLPHDQLLVSCIQAKWDPRLSTKADVARRLLLTSSDLANRTKTLQVCKKTLEPVAAIKYHMRSGMSWHNRLRHWARWVSATTNSSVLDKRSIMMSPQQATKVFGTVNENKTEEPFSINSVKLPVSAGPPQNGINQTTSQINLNSSEYIYWDREKFTETSAVVGHALREVSAAAEVSIQLDEDAVTQRTMFHPVPVHISRLFETIPLLNSLPRESLVLRFIPSPWTVAGPEVLASLPLVEMHFSVDTHTKDLHLKDVVAMVESTASEVMLPDRILDLRFEQRTSVRLRALHRHQLPQITEFLKASKLNLMRGRLETPPGITLPIAKHLCNGPVSDVLQDSAEGSVNVEYIFGGLEYRSTVAFDFRGWQLLYTSVEGGRADGRTGQLHLRPRRVKEEMLDSEKGSTTLTKEFVDAAYRLVDTLANYGTTPAEVASSPTKSYDTKELFGPSDNTSLERNEHFQLFRERINFVANHATEEEASDKEKDKLQSPGLGESVDELDGTR